jgi:3-ketosteroid 9alpha-monooxygenase subunit B
VPQSAYYRLTVKAIRDETTNARSFVLAPERGEAKHFRYLSGQFLTFRIPHESGLIGRSYSLSSASCADPEMTVCVKRVENGRGSNWFNDHLRVGERIEAQAPAGRFTLMQSESSLFLIAGGSGITPCISLIKQALIETRRTVKLLYANQCEDAIIYRDTLQQLAARYTDRFTCEHWLDNDKGFMSAPDVIASARGWENGDVYICGPAPLMDMAEAILADHCGEQTTIRTERFLSPDDDQIPRTEAASQSSNHGVAVEKCRITLDGLDHRISVSAGQTLLEAALAAGIDAPHACTEGHCGACMSLLREGEVEMASRKALSKRNIEKGFVLACQSRPISTASLWLDFDL